MLHPAGLRKNLFVLFLRDGNDARGLIEHHESRARRPLIDCGNVVFHGIGPFAGAAAYYAITTESFKQGCQTCEWEILRQISVVESDHVYVFSVQRCI